jgi:glycosyltransferase involved in cell wall biosynthesis
MKVLVYWSLGGIGGVQRFEALFTKALYELGLDLTALVPSTVDLDRLGEFHGVDISHLKDLKLIMHRTTNCTNQYCNLLNSLIGAGVLNEVARRYDVVFVDTLFLRPFHADVDVVYYLHGAVTTLKPRPPLVFKPHRFFLLATAELGSAYHVLQRKRTHIYANSFFMAYLTERTTGLKPGVLYPPVDIERIGRYISSKREPVVAMLARFSASKGHGFVIKAFKDAVSNCGGSDLRLVLMGATEDVASKLYVKHLMEMARGLGIRRRVSFVLNPSIDTVYRILGRSAAFVHVRPHEPFGIVVAEAMAAGAVPVVHKSGGPWIDIVKLGRYSIGFETEKEAAAGICKALELADKLRTVVVRRSHEFSYATFKQRLKEIVDRIEIN